MSTASDARWRPATEHDRAYVLSTMRNVVRRYIHGNDDRDRWNALSRDLLDAVYPIMTVHVLVWAEDPKIIFGWASTVSGKRFIAYDSGEEEIRKRIEQRFGHAAND